MKKLILMFAVLAMLSACNNDGEKTDKEKAADTLNAVDKAQEKMNELIDTVQSKGGRLVDTIGNKIIEPVKQEAGKVGEKIKEKIKKAKDSIPQ